jgi:amino acid adenylation domain-containing protein
MPPVRAESVQHSAVINLFEEYASRCPGAPCLTFGERSVSYGELDELATRICVHLRSQGIRPGDLVAVYLERSPELVAAILGVLKAGAGYLPVDPSVPEKRLQYVLSDAGAAQTITQPSLRQHVGEHPSLLISELMEPPGAPQPSPLGYEAGSDDLAYVIYTSGSTGRPKGVEVSHGSVALAVESIRQELAVTSADALLAVTSQSFDVSAMEIFLALSSGARLALFPQSSLMQGDALRSALEESGATLLFGTPSLWRLLIETGWQGNAKLRGVIGGELLDSDLANTLVGKTGALWNHYGPTETAIVATTFHVTSSTGPTPIGFPLPHIHTYVVNAENRLAAAGETGELLIGGGAVARGYRNHPELTETRFVWFEPDGGARERVYRTGDLVRVRTDGALEFVGRLDHQVKVRGFRIELEEIEAALSGFPGLEESVVVAHEVDDEKMLVAYYRPASNGDARSESIRAFLGARLPPYMVPAHFIKLDQFPLLVNGKIDRRALAVRALPEGEEPAAQDAPKDPITVELLAIWRRILRVPAIRPTDNFFDLGGHSLLAARLFAEIRSRLDKTLPLATLFEAPTVESLAKVIAGAEPPEWSPLVPIRTTGTGTPFFCVHPIGGNVLIFKKLSERMKSRPFYGLQARGLDGKEPPNTSIEEMAADYLSSVRQAQPSGPYLLGGYSAGGLVAFEMARLLQEAGEKVDLIVLFDTFLHADSLPPDLQTGRPAILKPIIGLTRRLWQMRHLDGEMRLGVIARDVARVWSTLKLKAYTHWQQMGRVPFQLDTVSGFLLALRNYRPKPHSANVVLFLADENAPPASANLPAVWRRLVTGNLEVVHLNIDHDRLLDEPSAAKVASMIEERFERQPAPRSRGAMT